MPPDRKEPWRCVSVIYRLKNTVFQITCRAPKRFQRTSSLAENGAALPAFSAVQGKTVMRMTPKAFYTWSQRLQLVEP
jgi:hypothetical protein